MLSMEIAYHPKEEPVIFSWPSDDHQPQDLV